MYIPENSEIASDLKKVGESLASLKSNLYGILQLIGSVNMPYSTSERIGILVDDFENQYAKISKSNNSTIEALDIYEKLRNYNIQRNSLCSSDRLQAPVIPKDVDYS